MKTMKKLAGIALTLVLALALAVPAFAATGTVDTKGSITISNAGVGETYTVYKLLDVTYDDETYAYSIADGWAGFFETAAALKFVTVDDSTDPATVRLKTGVNTEDNSDAAIEFSDAALAWAKEHATAIQIVTANTTADPAPKTVSLTIDKDSDGNDLTVGYYLVDSSMGILCMLTTAAPDVTITEKSEVPEIKKELITEQDQLMIGSTLSYEITVTAKKGADTYVVHDEMGEGLEFDAASLEVTVGATTLTANTDYTLVTTGLTDECTFEVRFTDSYMTTLRAAVLEAGAAGVDITLAYDATIKTNATPDNVGNTAKLSYGDSETPPTPEVEPELFSFDVVKTTNSDELLAGAQFSLYLAEDAETPISLVYDDLKNAYRPAVEGDTDQVTVVTSAATTVLNFTGFGVGTYYLEEVAAPDGYNKLVDRTQITFEKGGSDQTVGANDITTPNGIYTYDSENGTGVQVVNEQGAVLPSTGGVGTTIFYVGGGILVAAAAILLITKKRMSAAG